MKQRIIITILSFFVCRSTFAQEKPIDSITNKWSFSLSGYYYIVPHDKNELSGIGYADHKNLHLEARYNYEDKNTASIFAGWRFGNSGKFSWSATPMLGGIFGQTQGGAAGLEAELGFKRFHFYSETEYVIDFTDHHNDYLYSWSELTFSFGGNIRAGGSFQRSFLYKTDYEVQAGAMLKYSFTRLTAGIYYFNPFTTSQVFIATLGVEF